MPIGREQLYAIPRAAILKKTATTSLPASARTGRNPFPLGTPTMRLSADDALKSGVERRGGS
ncbi:hypothetical protein [Telmatospirillum sp.]|uniref:hypothetical protein n=1 Tax=Telmatospirillum sp. TaxID=2079197 RepID=UPI0028517D4D|nr:hypothetical protein [Telmatospirillum sp.]MDR3440274.1 hypothetical protein [Telmatospirillum sp.]